MYLVFDFYFTGASVLPVPLVLVS